MIANRGRLVISRRLIRPWSEILVPDRSYSKGSPLREEEATATVENGKAERLKFERHLVEYRAKRLAYFREVSKLRKEYAVEVAAQKAADKVKKEKKLREARRARLERQRLKNIRSGQTALTQEELRKEQALLFEEHLEKEQIKREAKAELLRAARQLAINELEKDAPHWLSTHEEVDAAFTPESEQLLWARPHGVIGSPNPCPDAQYWQQLTHTNKMVKSYKSQRQFLFERTLDRIYEESNLDKKFWTPERVKSTTELEDKARFRSDVEVAGRRELLKKQAQMLEIDYSTKEGELPKRKPPPSLHVLANRKALEDEGSKILLENPTKFFVFDERAMDSSLADAKSEHATDKYDGPSMGAPIGYRRLGVNEYETYLGNDYQKDPLTGKERKQKERENRLREAALKGIHTDEKKGAESAAEDQHLDVLPDLDYNSYDYEGNKQWEEGIDPETEEGKALLSVPPALRMRKEDVDWTRKKLEEYGQLYQNATELDVGNYQARTLAKLESETEKMKMESPDAEIPDYEIERIVMSMPVEELLALSDLDDAYAESPMSDEQIMEAASKIPSLSLPQLKSVLVRDRDEVESG